MTCVKNYHLFVSLDSYLHAQVMTQRAYQDYCVELLDYSWPTVANIVPWIH